MFILINFVQQTNGYTLPKPPVRGSHATIRGLSTAWQQTYVHVPGANKGPEAAWKMPSKLTTNIHV